MDFTLKSYELLLSSIKQANKQTCTILDYISGMADKSETVVLRHDVDRWAKNALKMAELEHCLGIRSTYYFRVPYTYKPRIIKHIKSLGHEIGFHYENLSKAKGNYEAAIKSFEYDLNQLNKFFDIKTICMHGSPLSKHDNRSLWNEYDFKDFGIKAEAYLSIDYSKVIYLTDTGRTWADSKANLRDKVSNSNTSITVKSTRELSKAIKNVKQPIIIQTHPERWAYNIPRWVFSFGTDKLANALKLSLKALR